MPLRDAGRRPPDLPPWPRLSEKKMSLGINSCYASDVAFYTGCTDEFPAMSQRQAALKFTHPLPYGAIVHDGGVQFVVFSRSATAMRVLLYDSVDDPDPSGHH